MTTLYHKVTIKITWNPVLTTDHLLALSADHGRQPVDPQLVLGDVGQPQTGQRGCVLKEIVTLCVGNTVTLVRLLIGCNSVIVNNIYMILYL